jgi:hypothetical protein
MLIENTDRIGYNFPIGFSLLSATAAVAAGRGNYGE